MDYSLTQDGPKVKRNILAFCPILCYEETQQGILDMTEHKIITRYDPPPIPIREFDWSAVTDDYEPGHPIGWGSTEKEAVRDLKKLIEEEI